VKLLATLTDTLDPGFGRVAAVDLDREDAEIVFEWLPPPGLRTSGKGFLGITWLGIPAKSDLIACAHAALCRIDARTWTATGVLHQPCMNDLHHVTVQDERLLVTNSGLDRVDAFDMSGRFLGGWDLSPAWIAAKRQAGCNPSRASWSEALHRNWEFRSSLLEDEPFTKPAGRSEATTSHDVDRTAPSEPFPIRKTRHYAHPNHVTVLHGRPLVTRFMDRSIQDLTDWSFAIAETPGYPHDGEIHADRFWITCTSGLILAYAVENGRLTSREVERIDIPERTGRSGWCRGLVVSDRLIVVGLTAVQYIPPFGWSHPEISKTETSILAFDRRTLDLAARVDMSQFGQRPKLFGLVELPSPESCNPTDQPIIGRNAMPVT
jgi:hypothetical protein